MKRRTRVQAPQAEINITSLLDITFVLLIAFMIVAPTIRYDVGLELPKVTKGSSSQGEKPVTVQLKDDIASGGTAVFVNGKLTPLKEVARSVRAEASYDPEKAISLESDRGVAWQDVALLITELQNNDIRKIAIVTEPAQ